jgi:MYXO-CTERM domain-containing protein
MSFLNPGDQADGLQTLPDPCATFSCGAFGSCVPVNMTPTCVCQRGYVATGSFDDNGARQTTCVSPVGAIPDSFYDGRLPELPVDMPPGVEVDVPDPMGAAGESGTTGGDPSGTGGIGGTSAGDAGGSKGLGGSGGSPSSGTSGDDGGCSCSVPAKGSPVGWSLLAPLAIVVARRRRRRAGSRRA